MPRPASAAAANEARNSEGVSTGMGDPPRLCPVATRGWRRTRLDTAMVWQTGQAGRRVSAIARHDRAGPAARVTDAGYGSDTAFRDGARPVRAGLSAAAPVTKWRRNPRNRRFGLENGQPRALPGSRPLERRSSPAPRIAPYWVDASLQKPGSRRARQGVAPRRQPARCASG